MTSGKRGKRISKPEVMNVSTHGFWLSIDGRELFLPFVNFPWFRDASIAELVEVTRPSREHVHWPALDVDLAIESIEHPERFPLVSKRTTKTAARRSRPRKR